MGGTISTIDVGRGQPLVFLHGFPFSRGVWQKQIDAFQSSHRVVAPDLPGFGETPSRPAPTTMAQYAADLHALLQQLGTGPVVLVGHSMGGYVALAFALQFPEMLRGLVLVGTRAGRDSDEAAAGRRAMAGKVKAEGARAVVDAMAPKMLATGDQDPQGVERVRGLMAGTGPEGAIAALLGMAERPDVTAMLGQMTTPTLVITGADDRLIPPAESDKLAQAIRGAQLHVIPRAGHLVAFEQPDAFNRALREWLDRVVKPAPDPPASDGAI